MRKRGHSSYVPKAERKRKKPGKEIFDLDGVIPGFLFGSAISWLIMFGYLKLSYAPYLGIDTFDLAIWLLPPLVIFAMAIFDTLVVLRKKEEEKWERSRK